MRNVIATKFWSPFLTPLLVLALVTGCSKDDDKEVTTVTYKGYKLQVDQTTLTPAQVGILNKVNAEEPIEFADISDALIVEHAQNFAIRNSAVVRINGDTSAIKDPSLVAEEFRLESISNAEIIRLQLAKNLAAGLSMAADLNDIKMVAEDILVNQKQSPIMYNVKSNSPLDLILNNKLQCYSGTVYAEMVFRSGTRAQFVAKNPVVIYKKNHVLPGYMVQTENGYELVEVETTVSGRGEKRTLVKDLYEEMRIIDAEVFALIEIFKTRVTMEDGLKIMNTALLQAAEKYSIPLDQIEPRQVLSVPTNEKGVATKARIFLNTDFMAFGDFSNMPEGDITRGESSRQPLPPVEENVFYVDAAPAREEQNYVEEVRAPKYDRENGSTPIAIVFENETLVRVLRSKQGDRLWDDITKKGDASYAQYLTSSSDTHLLRPQMASARYDNIELGETYICTKDTDSYVDMNDTEHLYMGCGGFYGFDGTLNKGNLSSGYNVRTGFAVFAGDSRNNDGKPQRMRFIMVQKPKEAPSKGGGTILLRPKVEMAPVTDVQGPTFAPIYDQPIYRTN